MIRAGSNTIIPNTCGVGVSSVFRDGEVGTPIKALQNVGGAGWHIASFTSEREDYAQAYRALKRKWKIVWQSPARRNERTGARFIAVMYDTTKEGGVTANKNYKYPEGW